MALLTPTQLHDLLQKQNGANGRLRGGRQTGYSLLVFDCRHDLFDLAAGRMAYQQGHLPGAYFLHLDEDLSGPIVPGETGRHPLPPKNDFIKRMIDYGLSPATHVVAYDDKGGGIAARLWWMLHWIGHDKVSVLNGGIQAWEASGYPLESQVPPPQRPVKHYPQRSSKVTVYDRDEVDELRTNAAFTLIDSRTSDRYRGEVEPIDPIAGHIPGAINLPWPENLVAGQVQENQALHRRFATLKSKPEKTVFYCGSGVTACHNVLAYYLATNEMPALYPGSWSEWITK